MHFTANSTHVYNPSKQCTYDSQCVNFCGTDEICGGYLARCFAGEPSQCNEAGGLRCNGRVSSGKCVPPQDVGEVCLVNDDCVGDVNCGIDYICGSTGAGCSNNMDSQCYAGRFLICNEWLEKCVTHGEAESGCGENEDCQSDLLCQANSCCIDTDEDGTCDNFDSDMDNDGVCNLAQADDDCIAGPDVDPLNPRLCIDLDSDGCDDCSSSDGDGLGPGPDFYPASDGADTDEDGQCDVSDPDIDNDGVCNGPASSPHCVAGPDTNPFSFLLCQDFDSDSCDDCSGSSGDGFGPGPDYDVTDDGLDTDGDSICDMSKCDYCAQRECS